MRTKRTILACMEAIPTAIAWTLTTLLLINVSLFVKANCIKEELWSVCHRVFVHGERSFWDLDKDQLQLRNFQTLLRYLYEFLAQLMDSGWGSQNTEDSLAFSLGFRVVYTRCHCRSTSLKPRRSTEDFEQHHQQIRCFDHQRTPDSGESTRRNEA